MRRTPIRSVALAAALLAGYPSAAKDEIDSTFAEPCPIDENEPERAVAEAERAMCIAGIDEQERNRAKTNRELQEMITELRLEIDSLRFKTARDREQIELLRDIIFRLDQRITELHRTRRRTGTIDR